VIYVVSLLIALGIASFIVVVIAVSILTCFAFIIFICKLFNMVIDWDE